MAADVPVPTLTTSSSMVVISLATWGETTRCRADGAVGCWWPWLSMVAAINLAATYSPPLAMVLYAASIWVAVTATPWPMGTVAIEVSDHLLGASRRQA